MEIVFINNNKRKEEKTSSARRLRFHCLERVRIDFKPITNASEIGHFFIRFWYRRRCRANFDNTDIRRREQGFARVFGQSTYLAFCCIWFPLLRGLNSSFEAVAKEIRDELLKDVDENDFVAETHEIHLNFPSYGVIRKEKKSEEEEETAMENEDRARMISEETKAEEEKEEEEQPTSRRTTRANALTTPRDSLPSTTQRSSSRLRRGSNRRFCSA